MAYKAYLRTMYHLPQDHVLREETRFTESSECSLVSHRINETHMPRILSAALSVRSLSFSLRDVDRSGNVRVIPCLKYGWPDNRALPLPVTNYEYSTLLLHLTYLL
jgi:hypothetical protein